MKQVTLKFQNLQDLAECMFQLDIRRPDLNYDTFTLRAELSEDQLERLKEFRGTIIDRTIIS